MNETYVTVIGNVASEVRFATTDGGVAVASFRVASTPRRYGQSGWMDGPTSYVTVKCWRGLAENANRSLAKGQPVVVHGRQTVRPWERDDGRTGTSVDIDADALGHDLRWGTTVFTKTTRAVQERDGTETADLASSFDTGGEEPPARRADEPALEGSGRATNDGWSVPGAAGVSAAA